MGEVYRARDSKLGREVGNQGSAGSAGLGHGSPAAFRAGSPLGLGSQPSQHPDDLRHRRIRRDRLHGDGARRGQDPARARGVGRARADEEAPRPRRPDGRRPRQGALGRDRPPRSQAREHHGVEGRIREDPGLRPGQADRDREAGRVRSADRDRGADAAGHGHGHRGLHVAGAGERPARRLPIRPVHARHDPLRDGDRQARVPEKDRRRDARRDHPRGARAARAGRAEDARRPCDGSSNVASPRTPRSATPRRRISRATCGASATTSRRPPPPVGSKRPSRCTCGAAAGSFRRSSRFSSGPDSDSSRATFLPENRRRRSSSGGSRFSAAASCRRVSLPTARRSSTAPPGEAAPWRCFRRGRTCPSPARSGSRAPPSCPCLPRARSRSPCAAGVSWVSRRPESLLAFRSPAARPGDPRKRPGRGLVPGRADPRRLPRRRQPKPARVPRRQGAVRDSGLGQRRPRFAGREASRLRRAHPARQQRRPPQDHRHDRQAGPRGPVVPGFAALAWSPKGDEVWSGSNPGDVDRRQDPHGLGLAGRLPRGHRSRRERARGRRNLAPRNRRLRDARRPAAQPDGAQLVLPRRHLARRQAVLFTEQQRPPPGAYVRGLDGSPAVRSGRRRSLCPLPGWPLGADAEDPGAPPDRPRADRSRRAQDPRRREPDHGMGELVPGRKDEFSLVRASPGAGPACISVDIAGGPPRAISPEGVATAAQCISPDGRSIVARGPDGRFAIYPSSPGEPVPIPWFEPDEVPLRWTADGRSLYVTRFSEPPGIVDIVEIATGKRSRFTQFDPPDPTGIEIVGPAVIAPDGKSYVYSYRRTLNDLYLATGMR